MCQVATKGPTNPDDGMIHHAGRNMGRPFSKEKMWCPSIRVLVEKMQKTSNKRRTCYRTDVNEDGTRYVLMASGKPAQVNSQLLNSLKAPLRTRNAEGLRQKFSNSGSHQIHPEMLEYHE